MLKEACLSQLGEKLVDSIHFSYDFNSINKRICQTEEFRQVLLMEDSFPAQSYFDLREELLRISVFGTYFEQETLFNLKSSLTTIFECIKFIKKLDINEYPKLKELVEDVFVDKQIVERIEQIIDDKGEIRDNASPELSKIRKELANKLAVVNRKIMQAMNLAKKSGWTQDDFEVTIRNGRAVIPLSATHKRKIQGFIHDESSTGQTIYLEPTEVFETNNEIRELESAERREIIKILLEFTDFVRPFSEDLIDAYNFLGFIDFIRAKAKLAIRFEAIKPILHDEALIEWTDAKHPLLYLSHRSHKKEIVPLSIKLDDDQRILIISGPNAGGKSVCLKTVGLLQYMLQCGLLVPMKETSEAGIFYKIFIDIGDEQSLENDLSTYSSHLLNIKFFLENSDSKTLFLIDEFGTGTEPQLGGAIAEASLEKLNRNYSFGVITTHYANLKLLAEKGNGIVNGAMLFDSKNMRPLYQLKIGKPGSSFAFEIARKIGLDADVLENASLKTGRTQLDFDSQLQQLEIEKKELDEKNQSVKVADEFLAEIIDKYEKLNKQLKESKAEIINQAKKEAKQILDDSNKLIEKTIKEIKESNASKEITKELRKEIEEKKIEIEPQGNKEQQKEEPIPVSTSSPKPKKKKIVTTAEIIDNSPIGKGDKVKIINQNTSGEVLEIQGKNATVLFGSLKLKTPLAKLQKIKGGVINPGTKKAQSTQYSHFMNDLNDKMANFKPNLDIRGKRAEEALTIVRSFIDDAIMLNVSEVSILHGTGSGILRQIIRDYLGTIKEVKSFKDEHIERGGQGITIVVFW